jgi:hypothetical protein
MMSAETKRAFRHVAYNVTFDGYHLATLSKLARQLGSPTGDAFAEFIWRLHNRSTLPVEIAVDFMEAAGYQPFQGFPLKRKGEK